MDTAGGSQRAVIFLDVDGVLTMSRCLCGDYNENEESLIFPKDLCPPDGDLIFQGFMPLERVPLLNLKWLLEESKACIVLSSTWRQIKEMRAYLLAALHHVGIDSTLVIGDTPCISGLGRGCEISAWLNAHPEVTRYVVIDDGHVESIVQFVGESRFVQTILHSADGNYGEEGLTKVRAEQALAILLQTTDVI